jgi:SanA protein
MKKKIVYITFVVIFIAFLGIGFVWFANSRIISSTQNLTYNNVEDIPYNKVGLLLGTSKELKNGNPNPFFDTRVEAAAILYKAGKIKYIVASGDNSKKHYNEPQQMKDDLIALGVPDSAIYLDYAGFRTLDSVVRVEKIFGQKNFTVISQRFHNERAIYIAQHYGLSAIGYDAEDVGGYNGKRIALREKLARVKVFIDFLIGKKPKFLGEEILIP